MLNRLNETMPNWSRHPSWIWTLFLVLNIITAARYYSFYSAFSNSYYLVWTLLSWVCLLMYCYVYLAQVFLRLHRFNIMKSDSLFLPQEKGYKFIWDRINWMGMAFKINCGFLHFLSFLILTSNLANYFCYFWFHCVFGSI